MPDYKCPKCKKPIPEKLYPDIAQPEACDGLYLPCPHCGVTLEWRIAWELVHIL